ncbi:hypothetical protein [Halegenticoccus soli]|uniref:hypothetical protein n=1 Tax=Halegenticoccus soli TaxID=1985678 RepID=UPI000C6E84E3|nr:hypothetical protein [Halegenticoccus soli]
MPRNTVMGALAALSVGLLATAAVGMYRAFSYLAALLIVGVIGAASVERTSSELDLSPYNGLVAGLTLTFVVGLSGIWLLWNPTTAEYTYVLGLPVSTLLYVVFIWIIPVLASFYYAFVFSSIGGDDVIEQITDEAARAQRDADLPLAPQGVESDGGRER